MAAEMTPRERVMTALNLEEPDRVPLDLGQAAGDAITVSAYENLIKHLGFPKRPLWILRKLAQTAMVDEDILKRFRIDFRRIDPGARIIGKTSRSAKIATGMNGGWFGPVP